MLFERLNGGGRLYGSEAFACKKTVVDGSSYVRGKADLYRSRLINSTADGDTRIRSSRIEDSALLGSHHAIEIGDSRVDRCYIVGATVLGATLIETTLMESCTVLDSRLRRCQLSGWAIVEERAELNGVRLDRNMRVRGGIWHRAPRYEEIREGNAFVGVTEGIDGHALVGCRANLMSRWIRGRHRYGKIVGYSPATCDRIAKVFEEWLDTPQPTH